MRALFVLFALLVTAGRARAEGNVPHGPGLPVVVVFSIDGLRSEFLVSDMSDVRRLMTRGRSTYEAELPPKNGQSAMLTGRKKMTRPSGTNVLLALSERKKDVAIVTEDNGLEGIVPSIHAAYFYKVLDAEALAQDACWLASVQGKDYRVFFFRFGSIAEAGRKHGWKSSRAHRAAIEVGKAVGAIAGCFDEMSKVRGNPVSYMVASGDAGPDRSHAPWAVVAPGITPRILPMKQRVRLIDTAPTLLRLLGENPGELLPETEGKIVEELFAPAR